MPNPKDNLFAKDFPALVGEPFDPLGGTSGVVYTDLAGRLDAIEKKIDKLLELSDNEDDKMFAVYVSREDMLRFLREGSKYE